jgi:5-methylcytosine-specific restriction endonuclease McrA
MILQQRKCLVLNKNWRAIATIPLEDAICKVFSSYDDGTPKARIIEPESYQTFTWEDWSKLKPAADEESIASASFVFRIPEIILLSRYEKMPKPKVHFSRRTLYKRDRNQCQYCGCRPGSEELTIEHVIPRCQGGTTTWENCVLACVPCNRKKAHMTPEQANMKLMKEPKKPEMYMLRFDDYKPVKSWQSFLGTAYWNVDLENENKD